MHNFKELKVWQRARVLVKNIYILTATFPSTEKYNLCSQMQSCSVSLMSTIAEGSGRGSDIDFARFLDMSLGSAHELESQLIVSFDLEYLSEDKLQNLTSDLSEIQRMIVALIKKLRNN
tara:strand:- start:136 stop:492 length:357 start_codon:yes stop_codon:yes gene_type:complete